MRCGELAASLGGIAADLPADRPRSLGSAAGVLSADEARSRARVHGDPRVLTAVVGAPQI